MKTPYEVAVLRKNGAIEEAYTAALEAYSATPTNTEILRLLGFLLSDQIKQFATQSDAQFFGKLNEFAALHIPATEEKVYENLLWNIRLYLNCPRNPDRQAAALNQLFPLLQQLPVRRPCTAWSVLVHTILQAKGWNLVGAFAYWCGFDSLRPEDFSPFLLDNGKRLMSLAEQLDCKIGKYLVSCGDRTKIEAFIPTQLSLCEQQKDYTYPPYFLAEMYIAVGQSAQAIAILKPFARKKANEFWVWELLAEAASGEAEKTAYLCRALSCKTKEEMAIRMYEKAAIVFAQAGHNDTARYLVETICRIRTAHQWSIPAPLQALQQQSWYALATPKADTDWIAGQSQYAEYLLFGHTLRPRDAKDRNKSAARRTHDGRNTVQQAGSRTTERIQPSRDTDKGTAEKKSFRGKLQKNAKGFGFVEDVFIPERLLTNYSTAAQLAGTAAQLAGKGVLLAGTAVRRYDQKKARWGWSAIELHPAP